MAGMTEVRQLAACCRELLMLSQRARVSTFPWRIRTCGTRLEVRNVGSGNRRGLPRGYDFDVAHDGLPRVRARDTRTADRVVSVARHYGVQSARLCAPGQLTPILV